ncbi:MAG: FAD-dependent oxidoreductase [Mollicutes bacterium]|nr:FAD-dependent oxidoreductase [Mollicutes bacterium]
MNMKLDFDVLVIGSGPAGMTAAIYLKQADRNVAIIDGNAPGGQLNRINSIENYSGFSKISGPELAFNMFNQLQDNKVDYKYGKVQEIKKESDYFIVSTEKEIFSVKAVIIATGRNPKELGLENEKQLLGRGISFCAICDGSLYRNKKIALVGNSKETLEEALYLTNLVSELLIVIKEEELIECDLKDKIINNSKIKVINNSIITKLNSEDKKLSSIIIKNIKTNQSEEIELSALFEYNGYQPNTEFIDCLKNNGYIVVNQQMRTNIKGIFACGDVIDKEVYQVSTAVAEGAIAGLQASKYID